MYLHNVIDHLLENMLFWGKMSNQGVGETKPLHFENQEHRCNFCYFPIKLNSVGKMWCIQCGTMLNISDIINKNTSSEF